MLIVNNTQSCIFEACEIEKKEEFSVLWIYSGGKVFFGYKSPDYEAIKELYMNILEEYKKGTRVYILTY